MRRLKPKNLEIILIERPSQIDKQVFLKDFFQRINTPLELRVVKEEPPMCCVDHTLEYIRSNNHCFLPDEKLQTFYSACLKEEVQDYECAAIIKKEADKRSIHLSK